MGTGWRRAFCTSIRRDPPAHQAEQQQSQSPSPRTCAKLGLLFSSGNPSASRLLQSESAASTPSLLCRTQAPTPPALDGPKLQCKTGAKPCTPLSSTRLFRPSSNPSSPISPSRFALFRATLRFARNRCGVCSQSLKNCQGTAVYSAECSHSFHFPCIAAHVQGHGCLVCPVCSTAWRQVPFLSSVHQEPDLRQWNGGARAPGEQNQAQSRATITEDRDPPVYKLYDDDEPLLASCVGGASRFIPIPEAEDENEDGGFHGFSVMHTASSPSTSASHHPHRAASGGDVGVSVVPVAALISKGRSHHKFVAALKVRAPSLQSVSSLQNRSHRAPIDLVTVLDVSSSMTGAKLHMLKRAMRTLISSLGPADRLALVAFSSCAKRLLPLRRMSQQGQRSARHIIERLVICASQGACVAEALRKATKVLEDRRERNPVATVVLLSDSQQDEDEDGHQRRQNSSNRQRSLSTSTTRFAHLEIPIHDSGFGDASQTGSEDAFAKCVQGLLSLVLQDVHLHLIFPSGEISAVYSCASGNGGPVSLGAGSSIRLGDLCAEEERELLVELRVPAAGNGTWHQQDLLFMKCSYRYPGSQQLIRSGERQLILPSLHPRPTMTNVEEQLRNLFVSTRALAESRRLAELNEHATAIHLLTSARSLLLQSPSASSPDNESLLRSLEAEIAGVQLHRHHHRQQQQQQSRFSSSRMRRAERRDQALLAPATTGDGSENLTPTSAWRAAERLAKVAIMRKSLNRVSDLHGFENARF